MDTSKARELLSILANGIDPFTGGAIIARLEHLGKI